MANITKEERERRRLIAEGGADASTPSVEAVAALMDKQSDDPKPPTFAVAERRKKHGDLAMLRAQGEFDLVGMTEPMAIYWGLTEHAYDLVNVYGWVPVHRKYLPVDPSQLGLTAAPDGNVTRGKNGSEMLFMMPKKMREDILFGQANTRQVNRLSRRRHLQQAIASAQADAENPALTEAQRSNAARSAAAMESGQKAKFSFTEYTESHSRNSSVE